MFFGYCMFFAESIEDPQDSATAALDPDSVLHLDFIGLHECAGCGFQTSIIAGTIFQETKKPLSLWFRAIWHITSQKYGANALGFQRVLRFGSYIWLHKLRRAMVRPGQDRLSGIVEVDESYIGGKKPGKRGRGVATEALVVIAAQFGWFANRTGSASTGSRCLRTKLGVCR